MWNFYFSSIYSEQNDNIQQPINEQKKNNPWIKEMNQMSIALFTHERVITKNIIKKDEVLGFRECVPHVAVQPSRLK